MDRSEYIKAKIHMNSPYNDGWTREFYRELVEQYEKEHQQEDN